MAKIHEMLATIFSHQYWAEYENAVGGEALREHHCKLSRTRLQQSSSIMESGTPQTDPICKEF